MRHAAIRPVEEAPWPAAPATSPQKIRWGAVFAGTVLGLALLALLSTLWFALGYGSGVDAVRMNLEWYVGVSAIACLFLGGLLAGWLSGVRGVAAGIFNGMAIWAMVLIVTVAVGVPAVMRVLNLDALGRVATDASGTATQLGGVGSELWATFWAMLGGLAACAIGGALGGAVTRPANVGPITPRRVATDDRNGNAKRTEVVEVEDRPVSVGHHRFS